MRVRVAIAVAATLAVAGCASTASPRMESPSQAPTASASDSNEESVAGLRLPPVNAVFDYQIGGAYPPAANVGIVSRDRHDPPAQGKYNICYLNAFQTQPIENNWWKHNHDDLLLKEGSGYIEDHDWPGELVLDLSTDAKRSAVATIVDEWIAGCATNGYQAVEPDNLDSWTRSHGKLTQAQALEYSRLLTASAHRRGLAIGQKNTPELGLAGKEAGFDFAIAEECAVFDECGEYTGVFGDFVIEIEYTDNPRKHYDQACSGHGKRVSVILRDRNVVKAGDPGYHFEHC